ncbi:MAG: HupE/UreJ family protein, partial [Arenimonas sp.]
MSVRAFAVAFALFAIVLVMPAHAHDLSVAHVDLVVSPDDPRELAVEFDLALKDLALTLPLDANRDEAVTWGELLAVKPQIEALVVDGVTLASTGGACRLRPTALATRRYDDGAYATLQVAASCPDAGPWSLRYTLFRDRDAQHRAIATLHDGARTATVIAGGNTGVVAFRPESTHVLSSFVHEGIRHLLIGVDHLAFLLSLVLPALLAWNGRGWEPSTPIGPRLRQTVWLVTAFAVAHSVTLTLAALGWVTPASGPVEAAIAASVLLAALNNVRPVVTHRLWLLSFGFGLVHG